MSDWLHEINNPAWSSPHFQPAQHSTHDDGDSRSRLLRSLARKRDARTQPNNQSQITVYLVQAIAPTSSDVRCLGGAYSWRDMVQKKRRRVIGRRTSELWLWAVTKMITAREKGPYVNYWALTGGNTNIVKVVAAAEAVSIQL